MTALCIPSFVTTIIWYLDPFVSRSMFKTHTRGDIRFHVRFERLGVELIQTFRLYKTKVKMIIPHMWECTWCDLHKSVCIEVVTPPYDVIMLDGTQMNYILNVHVARHYPKGQTVNS